MTNHVHNKLTVWGAETPLFLESCLSAPVSYAWLAPCRDPYPKSSEAAFSFNGLVPVPGEIKSLGYTNAGYDWQRREWGTKWDAYNTLVEQRFVEEVCFSFDTANSPPEAWLRKAASLYPTLAFLLTWCEDDNENGMSFYWAGRGALKTSSKPIAERRFFKHWRKEVSAEDDDFYFDPSSVVASCLLNSHEAILSEYKAALASLK